MSHAPVLTLRALNRATLARQFLLERSTMPVLDAVEHLGGLPGADAADLVHGSLDAPRGVRAADCG
jgi:hypothetical protein